jgi:signal transduction histidine kinase
MFQSKKTSAQQVNKSTTLFSTAKKITGTLLIGLVLSAIVVVTLNNFYTSTLIQRINSFALSVDPSSVEKLKDTKLSDDKTPYTDVKTKLNLLKQVYPDTRFVYLMDRERGDISFLADSEPVGSSGYSPRNEAYPDATDALKAIFDNKRSFVEGPVSDEYGNWYSALAPVVDNNNKLVAVIGTDVPVTSYAGTILGIGALPLIIAIAVSVSILFYDTGRRRRLDTFRFKLELMSIASHELRTPLSGIRWGEETLLKAASDEGQEKMLKIMYDSTLRLQESIEDILQLASMDSKQSKQMNIAPLDLSQLAAEAAKTQQLPAEQRDIKLEFSASWPKTLPINGDATRLRRVLNNLISNAIKYARPNTSITFAHFMKDGQHVMSVKNQGIGIPKDELGHVFDGFYRASNAVKSSVSGTGMGLFMSRTIIEQHGGRLWLESVENEDTTVFISLPASSDKTETNSLKNK